MAMPTSIAGGYSILGAPFEVVEVDAREAIASCDLPTIVYQDPPWSDLGLATGSRQTIEASSMELRHLDRLAEAERAIDSETIVGLGGGRALDTAKYLALCTGKRLVQIPSIMSVDAAFTDAAGVRSDGAVRYVGPIRPNFVVLDIPLIRTAPLRLNRAGAGDVISCHTGLYDWSLAVATDTTYPWHSGLADLGRGLLADLDAGAEEIARVTAAGVRLLASSFRDIGAACAAAGHSRFEEGSEHFFAYHYEHVTGLTPQHGEIVALGTVVMSELQHNDARRAFEMVTRCGIRCHPHELGLDRARFEAVLRGLKQFVATRGYDVSIVDYADFDPTTVDRLWRVADGLPRAD
jgi:glycerol-1-phosphate dehydrogenase [NAD(P)+]